MVKANLIIQAVSKMEVWLEKTGMNPSRLGMLSCANSRAVKRIRLGTGSIKSLQAVMDYIEANPADKQ